MSTPVSNADPRAAALEIAARPMPPTPLNRHWRVDFGRLDLALESPRPRTRPTFALDAASAARGVTLCALDEATTRYPELIARALGTLVATDESRFTALAAAFETGSYFLHVPAGVALAAPIELRVEIAPGEFYAPRNVVVLDAGARAVVHETVVAGSGPAPAAPTLLCGTTEARLAADAELRFYSHQDLSDDALVFTTRRAALAERATLTWTHAELGGDVVRGALDARLEGEGAHAELAVLYFPHRRQHVDVATEVLHAVPRTTSRTTVKAAAQERGQGRYTGNIRITPGAHGTEAALRDDSLLLSADAHIDAVPALEIAANDVQAFHGATVGAIDQDVRFYLMSRGIAAAEADRIVTLAFFEPALATIADEPAREALRGLIAARIDAVYAE